MSKVGQFVRGKGDGMRSLWAVGGDKIKKGIGYAGSFVKGYIGKGKSGGQ